MLKSFTPPVLLLVQMKTVYNMRKLFNNVRTALAVFGVGTWGVFALLALVVVAVLGLLYGLGIVPFELAAPLTCIFLLIFSVLGFLDNKVF